MHLTIQIIIAMFYLGSAIYCWHKSHGYTKHAGLIVIYLSLILAWQYHAYIITWLHASPEPLIQNEMPDAMGMRM